MWDAILDRWTVEEHQEMVELYWFLKTVLPKTRFPALADAIDEVPCLPIADGVFLHVRGAWYMRAVGEEHPNLPEWQTDLPAPTEQGAYDLDHEGWTPLPAFRWHDKQDGDFILMDRDLPICSKMAGWIHELIHVVYDEQGDSEAESELRTRQIEYKILELIEHGDLLPFSLNQELEQAAFMIHYWHNFLQGGERSGPKA